MAKQGGGLATPARTVSPKGGNFGFRRLAADGGWAGDRRLVRLPLVAGDVGVGIDRTLGRGHQCEGSKPRFGGELAGAGGAALKPVNPLAVLVAIVVVELGGEVAGLRDLATVELGGPTCRTDERTNPRSGRAVGR